MRIRLLLMMVLAAGCNGGRGKGSGGPGGGNNPDGGMGPLTKMTTVVIANGAPSDAPNHFGGPSDPSAASAMVYPPDGVLIPPNLSILEFQFTPAGGGNLFELSIESTYLDLKIYTGCVAVGGGCAYLPDEATWQLISMQARGDTATVTLRSTNGTSVGTSAAQKLSFGDEDIMGGLYYWAAANGAINRYDFGLRGQKAENFYTAQQAGALTCVGCHVLSRDGTKIAVGLDDPGPAALQVVDVATRKKLFSSGSSLMGGTGGSNFEAFSPDASKVLVDSGSGLAVEDAASGMSMSASIANANMPDWSPDGSQVVFARSSSGGMCIMGICVAQPGIDTASLFLIPWTGSSFGTETQLVTGGGNNYYPSFSPDGAFVAFNRAAGNSYDAPDARVLIAPTANGSSPIDLPQVNAIAGNSWPKFAPYVQHFQGKRIFWLTFSSRRDYGLRLQQNAASMKIPQIWMVAFGADPNETGYPTYPPFWLPFQDITTGNHIAQWTTKVVRQPCVPGPDAGCMTNETCMNGECVPTMIQ